MLTPVGFNFPLYSLAYFETKEIKNQTGWKNFNPQLIKTTTTVRIYSCKALIPSQQANSRQFRIFECRSMVLLILLKKTEMSEQNSFWRKTVDNRVNQMKLFTRLHSHCCYLPENFNWKALHKQI